MTQFIRMRSIQPVVFFLLLVLSVTCSTATAQTPQDSLVFTLDQAIATGLEQNFSIRISRNSAEISENNASLGNAGFLPRLSASGARELSVEDVTQQFVNNTGNTIDGAETRIWRGSVDLNWTLFDGLNMFIAYDRLQDLKELGMVEAQLQVEQTISNIIISYHNIIQQQKQLDVLTNTLEISQERIDIAKTRLDVGSGSRFDLLQAQSDFNTDKSAKLEQQIAVQNAKVALNRLLNRELSALLNTEPEIRVDGALEYASLVTDALNQNLELTASRIDEQVASKQIREITSEQLPQVDFRMSYNYQELTSDAGFLLLNQSQGLTYNLSATLNIFNALNTRRRKENARIALKNSRLQIEDQKQFVRSQLQQIYQDYLNALELVRLEEESVSFAMQTVEIAIERFRLGSINSIELREVQRSLINTESRLIAAQYRAKVAETELLRLSGRLVRQID